MGSFDSLRHRDFRLFWTGALLSNVGTWMQTTALAWYVFLLTHSAFWVSFVTFANLFPMVLAPIGGVVTDRFDRRAILAWTQSTMLVLASALALLVLVHRATLPAVMALTIGQGIAFALNGPTWLAFVPSLVPPDSMVNAIALNSMQFNAARVVGPAIGGALIAASGPGLVFGINAVSFVAVLVALVSIRTPAVRLPAPGVGLLSSLAGGFSYIRRHRVIRTLLLTTAAISFFAAPVQSLLPIYAADVFRRGAGGYGLLGASVGVGSVGGALALGRLGSRVTVRVIAAALALVGAELVLFALLRSYAAGLALMVVYGGTYLFAVASMNSRIQLEVDEEMRGRVMSMFMLAWVPFPLGSLVAGALASHVGARATTVTGAACCAAWGLGLGWRRLRPPSAEPGIEPVT